MNENYEAEGYCYWGIPDHWVVYYEEAPDTRGYGLTKAEAIANLEEQ